MTDVSERLELLRTRLLTTYDGLGQSTGRPYIYFVYLPADELRVRRLVTEQFSTLPGLHPIRLDLLPLTVDVLRGQEVKRQALLADPATTDGTRSAIAGIWARTVRRRIVDRLGVLSADARPVALLEGLAALHPVTNPTMLMESMAETSIDNPTTGRPVPIVIFVPGVSLPQASRLYQFLGLPSQQLTFYRGEEI